MYFTYLLVCVSLTDIHRGDRQRHAKYYNIPVTTDILLVGCGCSLLSSVSRSDLTFTALHPMHTHVTLPVNV